MTRDRFLRHKFTSVAGTLLVGFTMTFAFSQLLAGQQPVSSPRVQQPVETPLAIPMELLANRSLVRARINGLGPFPVLVAPEEQATLIDQSLATELKLKPTDDRAATSPLDLQMAFGTGKPLNVSARPTDMARIVPEFGPATRPRGIISASLWPGHLVTLDFPRYQLGVEPGTLPEPNRRDVFSLKPDAPELGVTLIIASSVISCRLDPLFPGGLLLPESYAKSLPLAGKLVDMGSIVTPKGRVVVREGQVAQDATLGMFTFSKPLVQFADSGESCRIGGQRLTGFSITYDVANARVRLTR